MIDGKARSKINDAVWRLVREIEDDLQPESRKDWQSIFNAIDFAMHREEEGRVYE